MPTSEKPDTVRLNLNLNRETADALTAFADRRGLTFTDSVRRCIAITKWIQDETDGGRTVYSADSDHKNARALVIL
jgi:hypothetical protein